MFGILIHKLSTKIPIHKNIYKLSILFERININKRILEYRKCNRYFSERLSNINSYIYSSIDSSFNKQDMFAYIFNYKFIFPGIHIQYYLCRDRSGPEYYLNFIEQSIMKLTVEFILKLSKYQIKKLYKYYMDTINKFIKHSGEIISENSTFIICITYNNKKRIIKLKIDGFAFTFIMTNKSSKNLYEKNITYVGKNKYMIVTRNRDGKKIDRKLIYV